MLETQSVALFCFSAIHLKVQCAASFSNRILPVLGKCWKTTQKTQNIPCSCGCRPPSISTKMFPVKPLAPPPPPPTTAAVINCKSLNRDERHGVTVHTLWYVRHDSGTSLMWPWSLSHDQVDGIALSARVRVGYRASEGGDWLGYEKSYCGVETVTWNVSGQIGRMKVDVWLVGLSNRRSEGQQDRQEVYVMQASDLASCKEGSPGHTKWAEVSNFRHSGTCSVSTVHFLVFFSLRCCLTRS